MKAQSIEVSAIAGQVVLGCKETVLASHEAQS